MRSSHSPLLAACSLVLAAGAAAGLTGCSPAAPRAQDGRTAQRAAAVTAQTSVLASASSGDDVFRLERHEDGLRFTASLDGGFPAQKDADHNWSLVTETPSLALDAVTRLDGGAFPDQGVAAIAGRAGSEVTGVDVVAAGVRATATPTDGYWVTAWRGGDLPTAGSELVLHLADGSTATIAYRQLLPH